MPASSSTEATPVDHLGPPTAVVWVQRLIWLDVESFDPLENIRQISDMSDKAGWYIISIIGKGEWHTVYELYRAISNIKRIERRETHSLRRKSLETKYTKLRIRKAFCL